MQFFEKLGEKAFNIAEVYINSTLQMRSPKDFAKNANANCGMWVIWREKTIPTLPEEDRMFVTSMNRKKVWLIEDGHAFTVMYPEDY